MRRYACKAEFQRNIYLGEYYIELALRSTQVRSIQNKNCGIKTVVIYVGPTQNAEILNHIRDDISL